MATLRERSASSRMAAVLAVLAVLGLSGHASGQEPAAGESRPKPVAGSRPKAGDEPAKKTGASPARPSPAGPARKPSGPPQVMSRTEAEARRPKSPLLRPPGYATSPKDRSYGEEIDWAELPAWRQTSFFGIHARGQFFVYVVDQSGSMIDDDRLTRAKIELRHSIFALQPPQRFEVVFYNDTTTPMPGGPIPRPADQRNKDQLTSWLRLIGPDGGTEPKLAVLQALSLRPDAVFLLSDGDFPDGTVEAIARANTTKTPIHCVDLAAGEAGNHLRRIAQDSGGVYASRPGNLHASP
ncbi:vWA domain-containing protein [Aquisphaera insulae]|uniref:vWA domain-containing protein n=1 Tax=Aquisphaera insulae TaxID=2712864 RepID=UPI002030A951|nr:magnesium chelatase [Aquisphaera insulae]